MKERPHTVFIKVGREQWRSIGMSIARLLVNRRSMAFRVSGRSAWERTTQDDLLTAWDNILYCEGMPAAPRPSSCL